MYKNPDKIKMIKTIEQWIKKNEASRNLPKENVGVDCEPVKGVMFTIGLPIQN